MGDMTLNPTEANDDPESYGSGRFHVDHKLRIGFGSDRERFGGAEGAVAPNPCSAPHLMRSGPYLCIHQEHRTLGSRSSRSESKGLMDALSAEEPKPNPTSGHSKEQ